MTTPASRTVTSSLNPSVQSSPRNRDRNISRTGEPGSAFREAGRGRGSRGGGVRGGRGGGHPPSNLGQKGSSHSDTANSTPSPSPIVLSVSHKLPVPTTTTTTLNITSEKAVNGAAERGGRPKSGSRKQSRPIPAVVVAPASPSQTSQTAPPTPSRSTNRRRRPQLGKGLTTSSKPPPLPNAMKTQKPRGGSTPTSQTLMRKDVPPHLVAAHEAEIRHDIDALVERVRAVAMAENRPMTPGSHIDWAGDEDDSLPDLNDWGVTTTHTNTTRDEDQSEEISPILADTLKPLPEPNSEVHQEEQEMEIYDAQPEQVKELPTQLSPLPNSSRGAIMSTTEEVPEQCIAVLTAVEESTSPTLSDGRLSLHPTLPPKPVAAMESLRVRDRSISKPSDLPPKSFGSVTEEEAFVTRTGGLSEPTRAPFADEHITVESVSSVSSCERCLAASIHAPVPGLAESRSAPSLLSTYASAVPRTHLRSQTEGRPGMHQPHTTPPGMVFQRHGQSGASSPLGKHVYTHSRNHSTPAGGASSRPPQTSRPVITGEAISRLARTIGGLGTAPRSQTIPVTKDSTISSGKLT